MSRYKILVNNGLKDYIWASNYSEAARKAKSWAVTNHVSISDVEIEEV